MLTLDLKHLCGEETEIITRHIVVHCAQVACSTSNRSLSVENQPWARSQMHHMSKGIFSVWSNPTNSTVHSAPPTQVQSILAPMRLMQSELSPKFLRQGDSRLYPRQQGVASAGVCHELMRPVLSDAAGMLHAMCRPQERCGNPLAEPSALVSLRNLLASPHSAP